MIDSLPESPPSPRTPPSSLPPGSTPIKPKGSVDQPFSTYCRYRGSTVSKIGERMKECTVGPMPVNDFLDAHLPISRFERYSSTRDGFEPKVSFAQTAIVTKELRPNQPSKHPETAMYGPFIEEMGVFVPNLRFVDTHTRGDKKSGYAFEIKPDVSIYHGSLKESLTSCTAYLLEAHIEFKRSERHDPFILCDPGVDRSKTSFIGSTSDHQDTLGQLATYAASQLASQFRTHCFSVFIRGHIARIIRWDREGAVVTEPIEYIEDGSLVEFFSCLSQAPDKLRGIDVTVTLIDEADRERRNEADRERWKEVDRARERLGLPPSTEMFKTRIGDEQFTVILPRPFGHPFIPACRGTRTCRAYDLSGDRVVFFKDSWRINIADIIPEGEVYAKLNSKGVPHVPTCLATWDVPCWPEQKPQTFQYSRYPWACQVGLQITPHVHHLIVLDVAGKPLITFSCSKELAQAIRDALLAHEGAFINCKILHRDVSAGNIIIDNSRGWLIDWDMAKSEDKQSPRHVTRTGTWQFMSVNLIKNHSANHTFRDDLESSFWVLLWTALMFSDTPLTSQERSNAIRETFESTPGSKLNVITEQTLLLDNPELFPNRPALSHLLKDLAALFGASYYRPKKANELDLLPFLEELSGEDLVKLQELKEALPIYQLTQAKQKLRDHKYTISLFDRYLQETDWPTADAAKPQRLVGTDCFGEPSGSVSLISKHVLERVEEESEEPSSKKAKGSGEMKRSEERRTKPAIRTSERLRSRVESA